VVWEDRLVTVRYAEAGDAATLGLRKASQRTGTLRLIDVDGWDLSACGGTHVGRTGGVGVISVRSWERFKGGQRVEFQCGGRVLSTTRQLRDIVGAGVRLLSVLPAELPGAIERLQGELREQQRGASVLRGELAGHQAVAYAAAAEAIGGTRAVLRALDADAALLRMLATAIAAQPGLLAVLVSTATPALVAVARSKDVERACDAIVKELTASFGGRGGGRPDFAQAGGLAAPAEQILARVRDMLG
jgi:alanyl-tRNA synthetase